MVEQRKQFAVRFSVALWQQCRAAVKFLKGREGYPQSMDAFMAGAAERELARLQGETNEGRPFPALKPGERLPNVPSQEELERLAAQGREALRRKRQGESDGPGSG